ncbi:MAG TPA: cupredoxin domain-containing protein [Acidimicrobiales bacterium]|nr:cupredoxin domain-containing protein [Acidimicrobiales bacterium]
MLTQASKVFLPLSGLAFLLALAYGISSGNRDGVLLLLGLMVVAAFAGIVVNAHRENLVGQPVPADAGPPELRDVVPVRPVRGGLWPVLGALAFTLLLLGFVLGPVLAAAGLVLGAGAVVGWMTGISGDHTGRELNLLPLALPVVGLIAIFSVMFFMSRVLLAVPEKAATTIALVVAVGILAAAAAVTLRPRVSSNSLVGLLVVSGVLMAGGGIVGAAAGQRELPHAEGPHAATVEIVARGNQFTKKTIELPAGHPPEIIFDNRDANVLHNVAVFSDREFTHREFTGEVFTGPDTVRYRFRQLSPGTHYFRCDMHPTNMIGEIHVEEAEHGGEEEPAADEGGHAD